MYKYIGVGLLALFAMMVIPFQETIVGTEFAAYGIGTFVVHDSFGDEVMRHAIHNFVVDEGETFINNQVFDDTVAATTTAEIGAICITGGATIAETTTASAFDGDTTINEATRCHNVVFTTSGGSTQSAAETFTQTDTGGTTTITGIGVCQKGGSTPYQNCVDASGKVLLAAVALSPTVSLQTGETVDIDYTFNIA